MAKQLSRKVSIYINGKEVENTVNALKQRLRELKHEQNNCVIGSEEYIQAAKGIRQIESVLYEHRRAVDSVGASWECVIEKLGNLGNAVTGLASLTGLGTGMIGSFKDLAQAAAEMDDKYADVMKTTGLTHEQVERLNEAFKQMDTRSSREQLNQLAYEAGKLGINTEELVLQFVNASDKINIALGDVLGEGAMVTIGKLSDVYQKCTEELAGKDLEGQMLALGSAVNQLGQSSTANEAYLVDFTARLGGVAVQAGLSADQILGFASALDQDMQQVEMSATAFQKLIQKIISKPAEFAQVAGMSLKDFTDLINNDMNEALKKTLAGFAGSGGFQKLVPIFKDLGLDGARCAQVISSMANSIDKVTEAQAIANEQLREGTSVLNEFENKNNSMQAQAEKAKKAFEDVRIELGNELYPLIIHLTNAGTASLKLLSEILQFGKENKEWVVAITGSLVALNRARLALWATKVKEFVQDKLTLIQMKLEHVQALKRQVQIEKENAAKLKAIAMEEKRKANLAWEVMMKKNAAVGSKEYLLWISQETRAKEANTAAINANTAAQKANKAVFASTPWGLIITAVLALGAGIVSLTKKTKESTDAQKAMNDNISTATSRATLLFSKLEHCAEGSDDYREALEELKRTYPGVLEKHLDENDALRNKAQAWDDVTAAIKRNAEMQYYESKIADQVAATNGAIDYNKNDISRLLGKMGLEEEARKNVENEIDVWVDLIKKGEGEVSAAMSWMRDKVLNPAGVKQRGIRRNSIDQELGYIFQSAKIYYDNTKDYLDKIEQLNKQASTATTKSPIVEPTGAQPQPDPDEKKRRAEELERIKQEAERFNQKMRQVAASGLDEALNPLQQQYDNIVQRFLDNGKAKSIEKLPQRIRDIIKGMTASLEEGKRAKVAEYLDKVQDKIAKLRGQFTENGDNQWLNKFEEEQEKLAAAIRTIDSEIAQYAADYNLPGTTEEEKKRLQELIAEYMKLKGAIMEATINNVNTAINAKDIDLSSLHGPRKKGSQANYEKQLQENQQEYDKLFKQIGDAIKAKKALAASEFTSEEQRQQLEQEIEDLRDLADNLEQAKAKADALAEKDKLRDTLEEWTDAIQSFADKALDVFSNLNTLLSNIEDKQLQQAERAKDEKIEKLDEQLEQGIISQEEYDERKLKLEEEYDEKEKEISLKQWKRGKALSIAEATIAGALAIAKVFSEGTSTTAMRIAMASLIGTSTALQIAAITQQPEPYAKGGYIDNEKLIVAGEAGREWIASNSLLNDPETAPLIAGLDAYQKGRRSALRMARPRFGDLMTASASLSKSVGAGPAGSGSDPRVVALLDELNRKIGDGGAIQAVISRQHQERFDANENFLRYASGKR